MSLYQTVSSKIKASQAVMIDVASQIHKNPELRYQEHFASDLLSQTLSESDFEIEKPFGSLETAFKASIGSKEGPVIAILAEYDALPEIGHACGHNLIAATALGAGLGLASIKSDLPGQIVVMGTPAEEGGGGKIRLIEAGAFNRIDAAMMYHPYDRNALALNALAKYVVLLDFKGKPSHAAAAPWDGNSALSGVIQTFNLIDNLRLNLKDGTRIHGIITNGGQADNIIPETAACRFSVRALESKYLDEVLIPRVTACAQAAALATGTEVLIRIEDGYKNMRNNMTLARQFGTHLHEQGVDFMETDPTAGIGSTDMGDVSQVVPGIHPYLAICKQGESICHQHAFAGFACSPQGFEVMQVAAQSMAATALDLLLKPELLAAVKAEFAAHQ